MDESQLTEDAASWLVRLENEATPQCKSEFADWLARSPLHIEKFLLVTAAYRELDGLDPERHVDVDAYVRELALDATSNTVALGPARRFGARAWTWAKDSGASRGRSPVGDAAHLRTRRWITLSTAAALGAIALASWRLVPLDSSQSYATARGEQRAIKLKDDSVIQLNTHSRVEVHLSEQAREVRLLEGEALFAVEHDPKRPFRVVTDAAVIQAIGTQFNVYRHDTTTTVSVVQGAVKISTANEPGATLKVGEEARIGHDGHVLTQGAAEVLRTIAWRQRKLDFRGTTLNEVAEQFNRYNHVQIRVDDPALGARQLNGVFNADEPQALLDFLAQDHGVSIERTDEEVVIRNRTS